MDTIIPLKIEQTLQNVKKILSLLNFTFEEPNYLNEEVILLKISVWGIAIFNFFDALFTYYGIKQGVAEEANPIMVYLWDIHPLLFLALKLTFSLALLFLFLPKKIIKFYREAFLKKLKFVLKIVFVIYGLLFLYHIFWISIHLGFISI